MKRLLLVDACNLLNRLSAYKDRLHEGIDQLAEQLLTELQPLHDLEQWELHLVVDGKGNKLEQQFPGKVRTLSILYTPEGVQADTVIESWLLKLDASWSMRVASEDRAIMHSAISNKAEPMSAAQLEEWVEQVKRQFRQRQQKSAQDPSKRFGLNLDDLL